MFKNAGFETETICWWAKVKEFCPQHVPNNLEELGAKIGPSFIESEIYVSTLIKNLTKPTFWIGVENG